MVSTELIEGLGVADAVDAMTMRFQHRAHVIHLDSPDPQRVLFGPAVTISFMPVRKDLMDPEKHSLGPAFYRSIGEDDPTSKVCAEKIEVRGSIRTLTSCLPRDGKLTNCI